MLRPSKHAHPDRTVMHVATLILVHLKDVRVDEFTPLRRLVKGTVAGGDHLFLPALDVLFLLGLIEYRPKTDAFEYRGAP